MKLTFDMWFKEVLERADNVAVKINRDNTFYDRIYKMGLTPMETIEIFLVMQI